jgi:autotransporter strand-loop-strand O-heptosyltransferase
MKITQVTPGLITIPPNGWGAIEKVIWNYHLNSINQGHESEIKYLNEVDGSSDIVHIHVANLALEAHKMGIPYIFSLHDHHVVEYGRESELYKTNLEAIKNSIISICHAEFLVNYFMETDKLFYLSHGVDTKFFDNPNPTDISNHKILCLANNGFAYNQSIDRKGFRYAIEAARELDLEITVAGPDNNKNFFESNPDLLGYKKLNVVYGNPDEESIKKLYNTHTIFVHPSILEAGHPNLTLLEAMSCGLPTVGTYDGTPKIGGLRKIERSTESVVNGLKYVIENWTELYNETKETRINFDWSIITKRLIDIYESVKIIKKHYQSEDSKSLYIKTFEETEITHREPRDNVSFNVHFVGNPTIDVKGNSSKMYRVEFWDSNNLIYNSEIKTGMWSKLSAGYFKNVICKVFDGEKLVYEHVPNFSKKRVYIALESKSLGDTMAWFPQCEEFRKKHDCELIVSTFMNDLFVNQYPHIKFVKPGEPVHDLYAMYKIGWFFDGDNVNYNLHPNDFRHIPLQQTASDILGLPYNEVRPKLNIPNVPKKRKIGIGVHSTAQAKYWNNHTGWEEVVKYLTDKGYEVIIYSKEENGYMGNRNPNGATKFKGGSIQEVIDDLATCEFFIGLGSGLSWLAWSVGLPVILISGFSEKTAEMLTGVHRVINENVCHGCFNKEKFDAGDWNWCPLHKNTDRQFECTKSITSQMIIDKIDLLLGNVDEFDWGKSNDWFRWAINKEIFEERIYEKFFNVEEGDIVMDIGASIGPFTYSILNRNPSKVYSIEPCDEEFPYLVKNTDKDFVVHINKGITDVDGVVNTGNMFTAELGVQTQMNSVRFDSLIKEYGITKIDFLKTDCEGGEYNIFTEENFDWIKNNVRKISGEWHLHNEETKNKFRKFRDLYLKEFTNHQVYSVDGIDIKWDLWNDKFIEYYNEINLYIDNM